MNNSYAAPQGEAMLTATPGVVDSLQAMRPWHWLLGVLSLVTASFLVLIGSICVIAALAMTDRIADSALSAIGFGASAALAVLGLFHYAIAAWYAYPGLKLVRSALAIGRIANHPDPSVHAEAALAHQAAMWRFLGISAAIGVGLYTVALVFALVFQPYAGPVAEPAVPMVQ